MKKKTVKKVKKIQSFDEVIKDYPVMSLPEIEATEHTLLHNSGSLRILRVTLSDLERLICALKASKAREIGVNITD